jgi:hypothetical protein
VEAQAKDSDTKTLCRLMRDDRDLANFVYSAVVKFADEILEPPRGLAYGFDYGPHWVGFAARIKSELQRADAAEALT